MSNPTDAVQQVVKALRDAIEDIAPETGKAAIALIEAGAALAKALPNIRDRGQCLFEKAGATEAEVQAGYFIMDEVDRILAAYQRAVAAVQKETP